jgi:hypothetical protein
MKSSIRWKAAIFAACFPMLIATAQNRTKDKSLLQSRVLANYPDNVSGVLIDREQWTEIEAVAPFYTEVKHGLGAALSYSLVPAYTVAQFDGQHADLQLASRRPVLCICRTKSVPTAPLLVRLHGKNGYRELRGGRLPVVGAQVMKVKPNDIIPADLFRAEKDVWLIQPKTALQPGEYALMIANDDLGIFPFTISDSAASFTASVASNR